MGLSSTYHAVTFHVPLRSVFVPSMVEPGGDEGAVGVGAQEESLGKRSWALRGKSPTNGDLMRINGDEWGLSMVDNDYY